MVPAAQIPDQVVTKTADRFLDYGIAGAVIVLLIGVTYFLARHLIECHKGNAAAVAAAATSTANHAAAMEKVADSLSEVARRLETVERAMERKP